MSLPNSLTSEGLISAFEALHPIRTTPLSDGSVVKLGYRYGPDMALLHSIRELILVAPLPWPGQESIEGYDRRWNQMRRD